MAKSALNPELRRRSWFRLRGIPVLLYHGIAGFAGAPAPAHEAKWWVSRTQFERHLQILREGGYQVLPAHDVWEFSPLSEGMDRVISLTFDDGRLSDFDVAFPLLQNFGFTADFFINPSTMGQPGFLEWVHAKRMVQAGMRFHSHGLDHIDLTSLPGHVLRAQIKASKEVIESRLGCRVDFLAAPYGLLNTTVIELALEEGYKAVCSSRSWPAQPGARQVPRAAVLLRTGNNEFKALLARDALTYGRRSLRAALLHIPKRLLLKLRPEWLTVQRARGAA